MNVIKKCIVPAIVVVLAIGQGVAQAQQPMPYGQMFGQPGMPGMMQQPMMPGMMPQGQMNPMAMLKLTEEQQKQLSEIANQARTEGVNLMKRMTEAAQELPKLMSSAQPDPQTIGAAYAKIFEVQRQMIEAAVANYNEQLSVFTEEQRKMWNAMRKQMPGFPQAVR